MIGKYKNNLPNELKTKQRISLFLFYLSIVFAVIAIANPKWGKGFTETEYRKGLDIDVSRSMDISDAQTSGTLSRLERGLEIAKETAAAVSGARFAAAIGRGRGYLSVPLTWDSETVLNFFETLDGSSMTGRSTNLEALLDAAADAFQSSSPAKKTIVFISDGESLNGVIKNAVNRCAKEGIIINAVAIGSDEGRAVLSETFAAQTDDTITSDILTLNDISRRDAAVMRMAAEGTGGIYIDGSRSDAAFLSLDFSCPGNKVGKQPVYCANYTCAKRAALIVYHICNYCFWRFKVYSFFFNRAVRQ